MYRPGASLVVYLRKAPTNAQTQTKKAEKEGIKVAALQLLESLN